MQTVVNKEIAIIGIGTQGSMIAFRNIIHGKHVVGFSRTKASVDKCKSKIKKWLEYYISKDLITRVFFASLKSPLLQNKFPRHRVGIFIPQIS